MKIPLFKRTIIQCGETLIDESDLPLVSQFTWTLATTSASDRHVYAKTGGKNTNGKTILMHRLIMGVTDPGLVVDHINGNTLDNRRSNLRICTPQQNIRNQRRSKTKGVSYRGNSNPGAKSKPWVARAYDRGQNIHLGYFATKLEAARAYNEAAVRLYGEFASLNDLTTKELISES